MPGAKQCWECRKRRLVCDFERPACIKCRDRGVQCPGYDHKPLRWVAPGETRSKKRKAQQSSVDNRVISPDLLATNKRACDNPFFVPPAAAAYILPAIAGIVVSTALGHRILQSRPCSTSDRVALATKLQHHRGLAIRLMADVLATDGMRTSDEMLACVLVFLFAEIQQSISSCWRQHVDAAWTIINSRGGLGDLMYSHAQFCHLFRYFTIIDVFGATTSPPLDVGRARRQLDVLPVVPTLYRDGLQTCVPCPPELLGHVILVNYFRAQLCCPAASQKKNHLFAAAAATLQKICDFSVHQWVDDTVLPSLLMDGAEEARRWIWLALTSAFKSAIALYCISTLFDGRTYESGDDDTACNALTSCSDIRMFHVETLRTNLQTVASDERGQLRKFTIWLLVVLGVVTDPSDETSKRFITGELKWISGHVGISSPLIAIDVLEKIWQTSGTRADKKSVGWDGLFEKPYIFAL
ncbi:C6 zinc finger domain protein [Metarhizium guizhouense ARSEF 977]|uniref:C6 zinc finger domain protein n=1 Tax=Metarhizium guizhouense (strain ARSEF 977) TaxID=1276136 RepID=A0A0B4GBU3_METGA|nr:C6 zinc finger domain protein [Metarhizium guizhouense ARSEF 977]